MGTSERTFNQVKEILGKLDRSIDQARQKRLHGDTPPDEQPASDASGDPTRRRARPLRPSGEWPAPTPRWQS
ncbi:MAG: hypothetical protein ACF8R7_15220 [Phycisphaerales bacterium JB039]